MPKLPFFLSLVLFYLAFLTGCQSPKKYWYHNHKTLEEAKWDLITSAKYTAYGCPTYCTTKTEEGIRTMSVLERNMLQKGYTRLNKAELPEKADKDTVWLHLIPYYVAGFRYDLPRWPQVSITSQPTPDSPKNGKPGISNTIDRSQH